MPAGTLTPRERVRLALDWQEPDRPPIRIYMTPEIKTQLQDRFPGQQLLDVFEVDFRGVGPVRKTPRRSSKGGIFYDDWGIGYRHVPYEFGTYPEAVELSLAKLETMDDVRHYPWPTPDMYDFSTITAQCETVRDYAITCWGAGVPDIVNGVSRGRGMEQVLMDIALRDEVGMAIIDHRVDFYYEMAKRTLEAGRGEIDILCLGEDCGTQGGRLFSEETFDDVFRPRLKKFYDLAHDFNAKAMMHSCGDTSEIMPSFIEMGLDVLDAMQPEPPGMDPETIRTACLGKLAFCGLISTQKTLPRGTVADCRAEARHRLDVIARGGGYIFAPAHCIQPDTPLENVLAVFEEATGKRLLG